MKLKSLFSIITFLFITVLFVNCPSIGERNEENSKEVFFPDKVLENAIRERLNKSTGNITKGDVKKITSFHFNGSNNDGYIENISGIENLSNLTALNLEGNRIKNISQVRKLSKLTSLNLANNEVTYIGDLSNLFKLTSVNLENNHIEQISGLYGLFKLTTFNLSWNRIHTIDDIQNLTAIKSLNLSNNLLTDIGPLENTTSLNWLSIENNQVKDISPLVNNTGFKSGTTVVLDNGDVPDAQIQALKDRGAEVQ